MKISAPLLLAGLLASGSSFAGCMGTSAYQTCYDSQSGNNYSVQRYGNTTNMQGYNSGTGSTWSQTTQTYGNTTYNSGTAADGGTWSTTRQDYGNGNYTINGFDSDGNSVNRSCFGGFCSGN